MAKTAKIQLNKEQKEQAIEAIKEYFENERGESIGNLAGGMFLDFITGKIAPFYYNQGITDAEKYMRNKVDDIFELII